MEQTVKRLNGVLTATRLQPVLTILLLSGVALAVPLFFGTIATDGIPSLGALQTAGLIFLLALGCEYLDSSFGMGYGTTLTPLLLLAGYEPLQIVPAVLLSEAISGLMAGIGHHRSGNVDLLRDAQTRRTLRWLTGLSTLGAVVAVLVAVNLPTFWFRLLVGLIIFSMGVVILITARRRFSYSARGVALVGTVAAFNKGLSGGGYGPLVTSGQVVSGVPSRHAIAITSVAEAVTCVVGLSAYLLLHGTPDWGLAAPLALGAACSVPLAVGTVRRLPDWALRGGVGVFTVVLGCLALGKLLF